MWVFCDDVWVGWAADRSILLDYSLICEEIAKTAIRIAFSGCRGGFEKLRLWLCGGYLGGLGGGL